MKEQEPLPSQAPEEYRSACTFFREDGLFHAWYTQPHDLSKEQYEIVKTHLDHLLHHMKDDPDLPMPINQLAQMFRTINQNPSIADKKDRCASHCAKTFADNAQWFAGEIGKHEKVTDRVIGRLFWQGTNTLIYTNPERVPNVINLLAQQFQTIRKNALDDVAPYVDSFLCFFRFTYQYVRFSRIYNEAVSTYQDIINTHDDGDYFLSILLNREGSGIHNAGRIILSNRIRTSYQADPDTLISAWQASSYFYSTKDSNAREIMRSLETMDALEWRCPGSVRFLMAEYGIRHFGRYPRSLLVKQFEQRDESNRQYFIILYPYDDCYGSFYQNKESFMQLFDDARDLGSSVRIIEARSIKDIIRRLNRITRKHGKASGILVGGHGTEHSIQFGPRFQLGAHVRNYDIYSKPDLARLAAEKYLVPHASVVLNSCSTGKASGIAQELSKYGLRVSAPVLPTNILNLELKTNGELFTLEPEYAKPSSIRRYHKGKRHTKRGWKNVGK